VKRGMKVNRLVIAALAMALGGCLAEHDATATLPDGARVTLGLRPLVGWHSDWSRHLAVSLQGERVSMELLADTGWWRGSNLYLDAAGVLILDEGQAGCVAIGLAPLALLADGAARCGAQEGGPDAVAGFARSRLRPGLYFVGRFEEVPGGDPAIRFVAAGEAAEVALPEAL